MEMESNGIGKSIPLLSRYKIDRRVKVSENSFTVSSGVSMVPVGKQWQPVSPKNYTYAILQKYFLKRNNSPTRENVDAETPPAPLLAPMERTTIIEKHQNSLNSNLTATTVNPEFLIRNNGKTLKRIKRASLTSSLGLLMPTPRPVHRMSNRVLQKSIQLLRRPRQVCLLYKRRGCCRRYEQYKCPFLHVREPLETGWGKAPKKLFGKQPCIFFYRGNCSKPNCPFPHVKVSRAKRTPSKDKMNRKSEITGKMQKITKRYFEQKAVSDDCISVVVPRDVSRKALIRMPIQQPSIGVQVPGVDKPEEMVSVAPPDPDPRRERLMNRIALMKQRCRHLKGVRNGNSVPAPDFLPLN